jgi:hypothetical protein
VWIVHDEAVILRDDTERSSPWSVVGNHLFRSGDAPTSMVARPRRSMRPRIR